MKWNKWFFAAIMCTSLTYSSIAQTLSVNGADVATNNISLVTTDGKSATLKDYAKENGLIVIFSCNTCPFVVGKEGGFAGWQKDYNNITALAKAKGYGVVLVNANEAFRNDVDSPAQMVEQAAKQKYLAPYIIDQGHKLADLLEAKTTPHVYMFDNDYKLVYAGAIDNSSDPRANVVESYLVDAINGQGKDLKHTTSKPIGCSIKRTGK